MRKFSLLVLVAVFGWSSGGGAAPIEWTVASGGNGHFYEVFLQSGVSWDTARTSASALGEGWDLASVTSQAEQDFITALLPVSPSHHDHLWLGANDLNAESVWEWTNGDAFTYENWWDGEPNDVSGEDYGAMNWRSGAGEWKWNDVGHPNFTTGYVVEKNPAPVPETNTALLLGIGLAGLGMRRRRR